MQKSTREQDLSLMIDRHMAVIANAGSGKTRVLVDRYVKILLEDIAVNKDPNKIIAITFTRKAASEMKAKINRRLNKIIMNEILSPEEYNRCRQASENMINARISTIHSFCARLLRDFPVEAGVSPDFIELSDTESYKLKHNAFLDTSEIWLENSSRKPKIFRLFNAISQNRLEGIINNILSKPDKFSRILPFYDNNDNEEIIELFKSNGSEINHGNNYDIENKNQEIINLHIDLCLDIILFAQECMDNFNKAKDNNNGLDFSDLLIKADELLDDENVRHRIQNDIKHILIDEFQDTDSVQYSLVTKIAGLAGKSNGKVKLFLVGDEKQSIYGFRNAEVEIFVKARQDLAKNNMLAKLNNMNKIFGYKVNKKEFFGEIELKTTFRLKPAIGLFINKVFENLMNTEEYPYDNKYIPFVIHREYDAIEDKSETGDLNLDDSFGSVKFLMVDEDNDDKQSEADLVANYILDIVEGKAGLKVGNSDSVRFINNEIPRFEDIAILTRSRTKIDELTQALVDRGIPYYNNSGSKLFDRQEIVDISSILRFINNSRDDISLIAALKSPFFNLTDIDIFRISKVGKGDTFWEKLISYNSLGRDTDDNRLLFLSERAISLLSKFQVRAGKISLAAFISSIIDDTSVISSYAGNPLQNQIELNLGKFVQLARKFQSRGFKNLYDFVEELDLMEKHSGDSQAVDKVKGNLVNILTIHAAKGLQYPIIILYNTNKKDNNPDSFLMNEDYGLKFKFSYDHPTKDIYKEWDPIENEIITNIQKNKDLSEEKRILYVAMSRAEDHLIISGYLKENKDSSLSLKGIQKMIFNSLEITNKDMVDNKTITDDLTFLTNDYTEREFKDISINIEVIKQIEDRKNKKTISKELKDRKVMFGHLYEKIRGEYFSPSKLMAFEDNEKYFLKYELGLPDKDDFDTKTKKETYSESISENNIGMHYGSIIHSSLENMGLWLVDGEINEKKLNEFIVNQLSLHSIKIKNFPYYISNELQEVVKTPLINQAIKNFGDAKKELILTMPFGEDYLYGIIDLMIINPDTGRKEIWDWKSNAFSTKETIAEKAKQYEMQMKVYTYFLYKLEPEHKNYSSRLLFTKLARENAETNDWTYEFNWFYQELQAMESEIAQLISEMKKYSVQ